MVFLLSLAIIATGLLILFLIGLPVTQLVFFPVKGIDKKNANSDALWALAPFTGYSVATLVLHFLIQANVSVQTLAWPLTVVFVVLFCMWIYFTLQGNAPIFKSRFSQWTLIKPSKWFVITFLGIVILLSIGYFMVGASYYRGTGQWDNIYLGFRAEAFRGYRISDFSDLLNTKTFLARVESDGGAHRISLHLFQALVASLCFTDGATVNGLMILLCIVFCFCAFVYMTKDMPWSQTKRYMVCVFGSLLPGFTKSSLDVFIGSCFAGAFLLIMTVLLVDIYHNPTIEKVILLAIYNSAMSTTYSVSFFYMLILACIVIVGTLLYKKVRWTNSLYLMGGLLFSLVLTMPYTKQLFFELGGATADRVRLDQLYPYANGTGALTATLWGTVFQNVQPIISITGKTIAVLLLICSVYGMLHFFFLKKNVSALAQLGFFLIPMVSLNFPSDRYYDFYRGFTIASPIMVLGLVHFWDFLRDNWMPKIFGWVKNQRLKNRVIVLTGSSLLLILAIISSYSSFYQSMVIPFHDKYKSTDILRISELNTTFGDDAFKIYKRLEGYKDKDILLVAPDTSAIYIWSVYYGRQNTLYGMIEDVDNLLLFDKENPLVEYQNIPKDAIIVNIPSSTNESVNFVPVQYQDEMAAQVQVFRKSQGWATMEPYYKDPPEVFEFYENYRFTFFSHEPRNVTLKLTLYNVARNKDGELETEIEIGAFKIDNTVYNNLQPSSIVEIPLSLPAGGSRFELETLNGTQIALANWEFEVQ